MDARFAPLFAGQVDRIRVGGYTFFMQNGKLRCCLSKRPGCSGDNWVMTEGRARSTTNFSGNRVHATHVKDVYEELPVWKCGFRDLGITGMSYDNFRQKVNAGCLGLDGKITDFRHFKASVGRLSLPPVMTMMTSGSTVNLWWKDDRNIPTARPTDLLHVIFAQELYPASLQRVVPLVLLPGNPPLASIRAGGWAEFTLPGGDAYHLYPFFGTADNDGFSPNEYFDFRF